MKLKNHIVILNWNTRASEIINDLVYMQKRQNVVVLTSLSKADVEKEACETVDKLYEVKMIDPLTLEDKIKELEKEIDEFQKNVDFVLSESNSRTYIEIPD